MKGYANFGFVFLSLGLSACQLFPEVPSSYRNNSQSAGDAGEILGDEFNESDPTGIPNLNLGSVTNLGFDDSEILQSNNLRAFELSSFDARTATGRVSRIDFNIPQEFDPDINVVRIVRWGPFNGPQDFTHQQNHLPSYQCEGVPSNLTISGAVPRKIGPLVNNIPTDFEFNEGEPISLRFKNGGRAWLDGDKDFDSVVDSGETDLIHDKWYAYLFCLGSKDLQTNSAVEWKHKRLRAFYTLDGSPAAPLDNRYYRHSPFPNPKRDSLGRELYGACAADRVRNVGIEITSLHRDLTVGPSTGYKSTVLNSLPAPETAFEVRFVTMDTSANFSFQGQDNAPGFVNANSSAFISDSSIDFTLNTDAQTALNQWKAGSTPVFFKFSTRPAPNNSTNANSVNRDLYGNAISTTNFKMAVEIFVKDTSLNRQTLFTSFGSNTIFTGSTFDPLNLRGLNTSNYYSGGRALRFVIPSISKCN